MAPIFAAGADYFPARLLVHGVAGFLCFQLVNYVVREMIAMCGVCLESWQCQDWGPQLMCVIRRQSELPVCVG